MILINVLPPHLRPIKRTPLPYIGVVLAAALAFGTVGWMFLNVLLQLSTTNSEIARNEAQLDALKDVVKEYNDLSDKKLALQGRIEVIQEILADRKIWSEHLHQLVALTPENIWYSRIRTLVETRKEKAVKLKPDGKPELDKNGDLVYENRNVKVPILEVSGYVVNDGTGEATVSPLVNAAERDLEFSKHFIVQPPSMEDTEFEGYRVRQFTLKFLIESPKVLAENSEEESDGTEASS
jgi:hypothetical protein